MSLFSFSWISIGNKTMLRHWKAFALQTNCMAPREMSRENQLLENSVIAEVYWKWHCLSVVVEMGGGGEIVTNWNVIIIIEAFFGLNNGGWKVVGSLFSFRCPIVHVQYLAIRTASQNFSINNTGTIQVKVEIRTPGNNKSLWITCGVWA